MQRNIYKRSGMHERQVTKVRTELFIRIGYYAAEQGYAMNWYVSVLSLSGEVRNVMMCSSCCWLLNLCSCWCNDVSGTGRCMFSGRFIIVWSEKFMCDRPRFLSWQRLLEGSPMLHDMLVHQTDVEMLCYCSGGNVGHWRVSGGPYFKNFREGCEYI